MISKEEIKENRTEDDDHSQLTPSSNSDEDGDDLILTESELFNKFKEYRLKIIDEEKAKFVEICEDVCASKISIFLEDWFEK